ncbi:hypothetical protein NKH77_28360 [Streptomyces sp. M19]
MLAGTLRNTVLETVRSARVPSAGPAHDVVRYWPSATGYAFDADPDGRVAVVGSRTTAVAAGSGTAWRRRSSTGPWPCPAR